MVSDTKMTIKNLLWVFFGLFFFHPNHCLKSVCFFTRMALHHSLGTWDARLLRVQLMASVFSMKTIIFIGISKGKSTLKLRKPSLKNHFLAFFFHSLRVRLNGGGETFPVPEKPFALHTPVISLVSSLCPASLGRWGFSWLFGSLVSPESPSPPWIFFSPLHPYVIYLVRRLLATW